MIPRRSTQERRTVDPDLRAFRTQAGHAPVIDLTNPVRRGPFTTEQLERHAAKAGRVLLVSGVPAVLYMIVGRECTVSTEFGLRTVGDAEIAVLIPEAKS